LRMKKLHQRMQKLDLKTQKTRFKVKNLIFGNMLE